MSRWFRWYEQTCEDGKFRVVARLSRVTVRDVIALWAFMLEDAANLEHRGVCNRNEDFMASILDFDDGVVERILEAMESAGLISVGHGAITICNWGKRQFEGDTDPTAADRQRRKRERDKTVSNEPVTRDSRPPETDTDIDRPPALESCRAKSRGSRIPADFVPHQNVRELGRSRNLTDAEIDDEFEKMRDHFSAKTGKDATKLDWNAAARNWIKRAAADKRRFPRSVSHGADRPNTIAEGFAEIRAAIQRSGDDGGSNGGENTFGLPRLRQGA